MAGKQVGLLDIDIHGPSVPKLLHIEGTPISGNGVTMYPAKVDYRDGILTRRDFLAHSQRLTVM